MPRRTKSVKAWAYALANCAANTHDVPLEDDATAQSFRRAYEKISDADRAKLDSVARKTIAFIQEKVYGSRKVLKVSVQPLKLKHQGDHRNVLIHMDKGMPIGLSAAHSDTPLMSFRISGDKLILN